MRGKPGEELTAQSARTASKVVEDEELDAITLAGDGVTSLRCWGDFVATAVGSCCCAAASDNRAMTAGIIATKAATGARGGAVRAAADAGAGAPGYLATTDLVVDSLAAASGKSALDQSVSAIAEPVSWCPAARPWLA